MGRRIGAIRVTKKITTRPATDILVLTTDETIVRVAFNLPNQPPT